VDVIEALALAAAAFAAGAINAVAGGGSLVSFPALVAAGLPAKEANVTNTIALMPGYLGGSLAYRAELAGQSRRAGLLAVPALLGSLAGSVILLASSDAAFEAVVPFLVLFACALMAAQDQLRSFALHHRLVGADGGTSPALLGGTFLAAVYGAYFGAGLGIITLALLLILLPDDLQRSNALKGFLSLVINLLAFAYFALLGPVSWPEAFIMAGGALAGGYGGVGVARRLGPAWLRRAVIAYGLVVAAVLLAG